MRSALLLGITCATALPLIGLAQGVPIIDATRVSNLISRLTDADRAALETYLAAEQRGVEDSYRAFEKSCRAN